MVGQETFRRVMGHFATGVTVVASRRPDGDPVGLTVNAFSSVSLDPPLILVCIHSDAEAHDLILQAGHFGVSILREDQRGLAVTFSEVDPDDRFRELTVANGPLGSPLIKGALGWIECRVHEVHPGGDHSIIVAEVVGCEASGVDPLLFFRGSLMSPNP
ncbi:MAG: flavin reductase family protein [Longimicrobiales bacterium]|nr:flavin reductase family protein [Longimicrobiales bacterium]